MTPEQKYIWDRISPEPNSGCWLWMLSDNLNGYGQLTYHGKHYLAHRFAFEAFIGPIPNGLNVCHTCDIGICLNPNHLFVGTNADNMQDAAKKKRCRAQKLTVADVINIRHGHLGTRELARKYNVARTTIQRARNGKKWAHVCP